MAAVVAAVLLVVAGLTAAVVLASRHRGAPTPTPTFGPTTAATGTATGAPTAPAVAVDSAVTDPAAADVQRVLSAYVSGIDERRYADAFALLSPDSNAVKGGLALWQAGQSTTHITDARLVGLRDTGGGNRAAEMRFTSTQSAAKGPNGQTCTRWHLVYDLVGPGPAYKIRGAKQVEAPRPC